MTIYEYYCEYITKKGSRCGEVVYARDSIEARNLLKYKSDFARLYTSPKKII